MKRQYPENWIETTLGEVAKWGSGGTPKRSNKNYYGGDIPWIKTGDLNDSLINEASEFITELGLQNSSAKLFPKGSVGIAMYGATIGKTALFGIDAATNQACAVAQPYDGVINSFLHYYLKSEKQNFIDKGKGGAQPNISQTVIKAHPFPLPPLPEQKRIVTKLDKLFGHLEVLKAKLDRIPKLLEEFRQSVLTQAVTGKLTEEWREGKDLTDTNFMINQIQIKKAKQIKLKKIRNTKVKSVDRRDNLGSLPEKWRKVDLFDIANIIDPNPSHRMPKYYPEGLPFLSTENIISDVKLDFKKGKKVSRKTLIEQINRFDIQKGDFLFTRIGTIGKVCDLPSERKYALSHAVCVISPIQEKYCTPSYLKIILNSAKILQQGLEGVKSVGVPDLGMGKIRAFQIPLPPIEEQEEITRRVNSVFAKSVVIESRYRTLKKSIEDLPQSLLKKAFCGKLIKQSLKDETKIDLSKEVSLEKKMAKEK